MREEDGRDRVHSHSEVVEEMLHNKEIETETRLEEVGVIQPPDGGYGWVVVLASFFANAVVDGVIFSIGETILPIWEKEFKANTATVSIATSLLAGSYLLSGPLASALANHFGCHLVAIAGALIAALGFFVSALMPALPVIYFTFGIVGGVGFGLIFLPAVVIVGQYFSNKRALATGIAVCGSGIGTSIFSYLNPLILELCGGNWRFFMFTIAGITCSCCIFGYFFKPLQPTASQVKKAAEIAKEYMDQKAEILEHEPTLEVIDNDNQYISAGTVIERLPRQSLGSRTLNPEAPFLSTLSLNTGAARERAVWGSEVESLQVTRKSLTALNRPLSKPDAFYPGSTQKLNERNLEAATHRPSRSVSALSAGAAAPHHSQLMLSTAALPTTESYATGNWSEGIFSALRLLFDFDLLYSPTFHVLAISGFLTLTCFFVPFMFLGQSAIEKGVEPGLTKYLVFTLGAVNVFARIICGYISDHPNVDPLWVTNISLIIAGLVTIGVPYVDQFWHYIIYCIFFAVGVACFAALRSIIVVEIFGLERLTSAYGILLLYMGVAAFVGPPFAAYLKTVTSNYTLSFIVMGSLMTLSGLIAIPLRRINAWEQKRNMEKANPVEMKPLTNGNNH
uniref:Major facilitator superfamily (MFS) profile domain-containing protein n=1 Tax=Panagrolaimus sp. ES5 TaxID=591445 RepID=A0AC34GQ21_9BILA